MIPRRIDLAGDAAAVHAAPPQHETKFVFGCARYHVVRRWLESRCAPDPRFPASIVSSVYFDSRDWRSLGEKVNGDVFKVKARIRWYAHFDSGEPTDSVHLEAKFKSAGRRGKLRVPIDLSGRTLAGLDLQLSGLPDVAALLRAHGVELPGLLFPVFRIDYRRLRFLDPLTRENVCLDYAIHVPRVNRRMVRRHDPRCLPEAVFELKGRSTELSPALRPLAALGCSKQSFSKYLACHGRLA